MLKTGPSDIHYETWFGSDQTTEKRKLKESGSRTFLLSSYKYVLRCNWLCTNLTISILESVYNWIKNPGLSYLNIEYTFSF